MYTVKEVCEMTGISYHTLKYYCAQGIIPQVARDGENRRVFDDKNVGWIRDVLVLRSIGMSIKEMKDFTKLCLEGSQTIPQRMEMLTAREEALKQEQEELARALKALQATRKEYEDILAGQLPYECNLRPESNEEMLPDQLRQSVRAEKNSHDRFKTKR